jgi:hypothetical protein
MASTANPIKKGKKMMRNLKALGLALIALFAMSAVVASTASAQLGKITSDGPVTLKGTETGAGQNRLTAFSTNVECPGSTYTGHKTNSESSGVVSGETSVTIRPNYINCVQGGVPAEVDMNGCHYAFYDATTNPVGNKEDTYSVKADIVGKDCTHIVVTTNLCAMTIKRQTGITGAHLKTTTVPDDVDLTGTFSGIHAVCGFLTTSNAQLDVDVTIKGFNPVTSVETGVTITD